MRELRELVERRHEALDRLEWTGFLLGFGEAGGGSLVGVGIAGAHGGRDADGDEYGVCVFVELGPKFVHHGDDGILLLDDESLALVLHLAAVRGVGEFIKVHDDLDPVFLPEVLAFLDIHLGDDIHNIVFLGVEFLGAMLVGKSSWELFLRNADDVVGDGGGSDDDILLGFISTSEEATWCFDWGARTVITSGGWSGDHGAGDLGRSGKGT